LSGVEAETESEKSYFEVEVTTERGALIRKLNGICNQLLKWGLSHNPASVNRVAFFRAAIYATSTQLSALKDNELDELKLEVERIKERLKI